TGFKYGYDNLSGKLDSIRVAGALTRLAYNSDGVWNFTYFPGGESVEESFSSMHEGVLVQAYGDHYGGTPIARAMQVDLIGKISLQTDGNVQGQGVAYQYNTWGDRLTRMDSVSTGNCHSVEDPFGFVCDTTSTVNYLYS